MPTPSLEQLFRTFLATGDEAALALWMRRSAPTLRAAARRLGATADDAEDLVQETLVAAIHGASRWDPARPLLPWLKGILTFKAAKHARDAARRPARPGAVGEAPVEALVEAAPAVVDDLSGRELHADVHAAIAQLPERYRAPLQQFLFAQRTPVEIAHGLGLERATVRVHLHRGLARLRAMLQRWAGLLLLLCFGRTASASPATRTARGLALLGTFAAVAWLVWPAPGTPPLITSMPTIAAAAATVPATPPAAANDTSANVIVDAARRPAAHQGLRLRVLAADGTALPHVGAHVAPADGRDPVLHRRRTVSDANGMLHWPTATTGRWRVVLDRGLRRTFDLEDEGDTAVHEVTVRSGRTVRGRVLAPDGTPVADARVWLGEPGDPWRGTDVVTTAADGTFTLRHVPASARLAARHAQFAGTEPIAIEPDGSCTLHLRDAAPAATVRVVTAAGAPVPDALVFVGDAADAAPVWLADGAAPLRPPPCEGRTDANGALLTFALPVLRQRLAVRAAGHAPFQGWLAPDAAGTHTVVMQPGLLIEGTVRDANGHAIAGADVVHRGLAAGNDIDLVSDAHGRFVFEGVGVGGNELAVKAPGHTPRAVVLPSPMPGSPVAVDLVLAAARTIHARVVDPQGHGVAGDLRASWPESHLEPTPRLAAVDGTGHATFADGRPGLPQLAFRPAGEPLWRDVDALANWRGDYVELALPTGFPADAWLTGTLRTSDGRALPAARLFVHRDGVQWAELGSTDAAGTFRLGPLPAGRYVLFAETTDASLPTFVDAPVDLVAGATVHLERSAPPTGRLDLEFALADEATPADLVVTIVDRTLHRRCASHTRHHVEQVLAPGDYLVYVMGSRVAWQQAIPVHIDAGRTTVAVVPLHPGHRVSFAPIGLPPATVATPRTFVLFDALGGEVGTWTLPFDHALRLAAVLRRGRYELRHVLADGSGTAGEFEVADDGGAMAFQVAMHPR